MHFSEVLDSIQYENDSWALNIPEDWQQGRTVFGGLQAAIALHAMRSLVPADTPLRTLQTTFIAPIKGKVVKARAKKLRSGKFTTHVEARLQAGDNDIAVMLAVFGSPRTSQVSFLPPTRPVDCSKRIIAPFVPGITPNFYKHFSACWLHGGLPFSGALTPKAVIELSMLDPGPTTESHILAMADFIPPIALSLFKKPTMGSSLTWMLEFMDAPIKELSLTNWQIDVNLNAASDGYTSQSATVWSPHGELIALSNQSMVVFG